MEQDIALDATPWVTGTLALSLPAHSEAQRQISSVDMTAIADDFYAFTEPDEERSLALLFRAQDCKEAVCLSNSSVKSNAKKRRRRI